MLFLLPSLSFLCLPQRCKGAPTVRLYSLQIDLPKLNGLCEKYLKVLLDAGLNHRFKLICKSERPHCPKWTADALCHRPVWVSSCYWCESFSSGGQPQHRWNPHHWINERSYPELFAADFLIICTSIGSLGKNNSTGIVERVFLDTAFIRDTTNGLRIKTWQVTPILTSSSYINAQTAAKDSSEKSESCPLPSWMNDVSCLVGRLWLREDSAVSRREDGKRLKPHHHRPILLWLAYNLPKPGYYYISTATHCQKTHATPFELRHACLPKNVFKLECLKTSAVEIGEIMFKNITGTSESRIAMKFACSDTVPCTNIVLDNINLQRENGTVETYCNNASGFDYGNVHPSADCLASPFLCYLIKEQYVSWIQKKKKNKRRKGKRINPWRSNVLHLKQKVGKIEKIYILNEPPIEVQFIVRMPLIWYR